jgi:myo-inositol-1(or 4)-monophosphatase
MTTNLDEYSRVCEKAVRLGGQTIQQWVGRFDVQHKGPTDLVTQADLASQEAVRKTVLGAFPEHSLLGEESVPGDDSCTRAEFRWIVDPLDGTTNFVHGVPFYCVSLALERKGELLVGAVYDPTRDDCFLAVKGQGAHLNGQPIHTSHATKTSDALAAVGFPYNATRTSPDVLLFLAMLNQCQGIRRTGSSALNLCYLAAGRFDINWAYATHIWDIAAGVLILREAGGQIISTTGGELSLEEPRFLAAATPELLAQLRDIATTAVPQ